MNYQEPHNLDLAQNFASYIMKSKRYEKAFSSAITSLQNSLQKSEAKTKINDPKNNNQNRLKSLIKINKNIENAFPENFFSNKKTLNGSDQKRYGTKNGKKFKLNLQELLAIKSEQKKDQLQLMKHQSIQLNKPHCKESYPNLIHREEKSISNRFKIKSIRSSRTSIQKKNQILFSFQKDQSKILPQTAQTLDNCDEEQLMNITFGNNFGKIHYSAQSQQLIQNNENRNFSKLLEQKNQDKPARKMKNVCSLELKYERSIQISRKKNSILHKQKQKQTLGYFSDRKLVPQKERCSSKQFKIQEEVSMNPFKKIRFDVEQLLKRKTLVLPKMKNINPQNKIRKTGLSKQGKLPF